MSFEFGARSCAHVRGADEDIWLKALMHFSIYVMIAALIIMGLELAYALYQLAGHM
jgi:hypothetical protein